MPDHKFARRIVSLSLLLLPGAFAIVPATAARAAERPPATVVLIKKFAVAAPYPPTVALLRRVRAVPDPRTVALLKRVQAAYKQANTMTADFTYSVTEVKRQQLIEGSVLLKKPNLARVTFSYLRQPAYHSLIGSDGTHQFIFTPDSFDTQTRRFRDAPFDSLLGARQASGLVGGGGTITTQPIAPDGANLRLWDAAPIPAFFDPINAIRNTLYQSDPDRMHYEGKQILNGVTYEVLQSRYGNGNIAGGADSNFDQRLYIGADNLIHQYVLEFRSGGRPGVQVVRLRNIRVNVPIEDSEFAFTPPSEATATADAPAFTRTQDVVYGRKYGSALTMDVFAPTQKPNGRGIIWVVSGGWVSSHNSIGASSPFVGEFLKRGYTVFAVVHGSQPKYTIPEILTDMNRAVRFIRFHAADYGIDPDHIGITGASAGGHLSLMQGTAGDTGDPNAKDPIDRVSNRVQAVACFFPPTDFLNYGKTGNEAIGINMLSAFRPPFDFHIQDPAQGNIFVRITDPAQIREIAKNISPRQNVTPDDAPSLLIHGDADPLVPLQQSESMVARLKEAGVPAELVIHKGGGHGWPDIAKDVPTLADWFDKYLKPAPRQ